jgi:CubicO group peptidase (beta-lactamase class C family)
MRPAFLTFAVAVALSAQSSTYWPGREWRTSTPEAQGIDSHALAAVLDRIAEKRLGVHSLLVIRHGYAVLNATFYPYDPAVPHDLASITKTITSTLTGIASGQGILDLDRPLLSFFEDERPARPDEQKQRITVRHMLRMESGLDCGYLPGERELEQMKRSPNWVAFALALPMKYEPGTHAAYCSPGYHLLGAALGAAARQTEFEFAKKNLFEPLGIRDALWPPDAQGRSHGWGDSHLYPRDVAKIGYLYLNQGKWNGKQIVPAAWVAMSTAPHPADRNGPGGLGYEWGASNGPNGRQFGASGRGGQSLVVWPDLDTIVVITAGGNAGQLAPLIRQAIKSDTALPAVPAAVRQLQEKAAAAVKPPPAEAVAAPPATAAAVSGVVYHFPINPSRLDSLALHFQGERASVAVNYLGEELTFPVSLNGQYALGPNGPLHLPAGARGKWVSENEFQLDLNFTANINHYDLRVRFSGDIVEVIANEASGLIRDGKLTGTRKRTN